MTTIRLRTWMLRFAAVWFLIVAVGIFAKADDIKHLNPHRFDGYDWISWSNDSKIGYIYGLRAGVYFSSYIMWEQNLSANRLINPLLEFSTDDLIKIVDQTYRDSKKKVPTRNGEVPIRQLPIGVVWRLAQEGKL